MTPTNGGGDAREDFCCGGAVCPQRGLQHVDRRPPLRSPCRVSTGHDDRELRRRTYVMLNEVIVRMKMLSRPKSALPRSTCCVMQYTATSC